MRTVNTAPFPDTNVGTSAAGSSAVSDTEEETEWKCLRCLWLIGGREGSEITEHATQCPFHGTGADPDPADLAIGARPSLKW